MNEIRNFDPNSSVFGADEKSAEMAASIRREQVSDRMLEGETDPVAQGARVGTDQTFEQAKAGMLLLPLDPAERQELRELQIKINEEDIPGKPAVSEDERSRFVELQKRLEARGVAEENSKDAA